MHLHEQIISRTLVQLTSTFIATQTPFTLTLLNNKYWDAILPERLKGLELIMFDMSNTDLEESYIDENGQCIISLGIDDVVYQGILSSENIHAVGLPGKPALLVKQFIEPEPTDDIIEGSEQRSLEYLSYFNSHLIPTLPVG